MIEGITGKVGSGKSLLFTTNALREIVLGGCVATNIEFDRDALARFCWKRGHRFRDDQYVFLDMRKDPLFHRYIPRGTSRTVHVGIDEAHLFFPASEYRDLRKAFLEVEAFVSQSRKAKVDIFLITQAWENVWGQLRRQALFVYNCRDLRQVKFPLLGKGLGGLLGLSWSRMDAATNTVLERGRTAIASDVCSCYSTMQAYDDMTSELLRTMAAHEVLVRPVGFFRRTFCKPSPSDRAVPLPVVFDLQPAAPPLDV